MATKGKEPPPTKEKRGNSPSYPRRKSSPSTSKQGSPVRKQGSSNPPSDRQVPNYLKPTISSGCDPSLNNVKKHNAPGDTRNISSSNLTRRRSLDKPLPHSHVQKTRISPGPGERNLRSSSFTAKSTTSKKIPSERSSKGPKDAGKEHSLYARSVSSKKTSMNVKNQETVDSNSDHLSTKDPLADSFGNVDATVIVGDIPVPETPALETQHQEDQGLSITEADEEVLNIGNNNETATEVLVMEDNEQMDMTPSECGSHEIESSMIPDCQDEGIGNKIEKQEENLDTGESSKIQSESIEQQDEMEDPQNENDKAANEAKAEIEEEEGGEKEDSRGQELDEEQLAVNEGNQDHVNPQEMENNAEDNPEEAAKEDEENTTAAVKQQKIGVERKKDNSTVSNDVIEETASKLREQRTNRVKALAGAFETVISLQEPK